jgi:hypothetical protein
MRKTLLIAAASILIPFGGVQASVNSDIASGLSMQQVAANAALENLTIEQVIQQVSAINSSLVSSLVTLAINNGANAESVLFTAFNAAPGEAKSISEAAQAAGVDFTVVVAQSLGVPGIDPLAIAPATAAGGTPPGQQITTPGQGGTPPGLGGTTPGQTISPPSFSNGGGSGGGGTGSPTT